MYKKTSMELTSAVSLRVEKEMKSKIVSACYREKKSISRWVYELIEDKLNELEEQKENE